MVAHRWLRLGDKLGSLTPYFAGLLAIYVLDPFPDHLSTAIHLLGPPDRVAFHVGALRVGLGVKPGGEVEYSASGLSAAQSAVIAAAGPAADIVTAPLVLLLPIPRWAAFYFAVIMAASGLANLSPRKPRTVRSATALLSSGRGLVLVRTRTSANCSRSPTGATGQIPPTG